MPGSLQVLDYTGAAGPASLCSFKRQQLKLNKLGTPVKMGALHVLEHTGKRWECASGAGRSSYAASSADPVARTAPQAGEAWPPQQCCLLLLLIDDGWM